MNLLVCKRRSMWGTGQWGLSSQLFLMDDKFGQAAVADECWTVMRALLTQLVLWLPVVVLPWWVVAKEIQPTWLRSCCHRGSSLGRQIYYLKCTINQLNANMTSIRGEKCGNTWSLLYYHKTMACKEKPLSHYSIWGCKHNRFLTTHNQLRNKRRKDYGGVLLGEESTA